MICDSTIGAAAKLLLQALAMLPDTALTGEGIDANYGGDYFYFNNGTAERCPYRGAHWNNGGLAGGVGDSPPLYFVKEAEPWKIRHRRKTLNLSASKKRSET